MLKDITVVASIGYWNMRAMSITDLKAFSFQVSFMDVFTQNLGGASQGP